jgi:hypothetical protein
MKTNIEFGVKGDLIAWSVAIKHIGIGSNTLVGTLKGLHSPHPHGRYYVQQVTYCHLLKKCSANFIGIEWLFKKFKF